MKVCTSCEVPKELSEFGKQKRSPSGYRNICKQCRHDKEYLPSADAKKAAIKIRYKNDSAFREYVRDKADRQYAADTTSGKQRSRKSTLGRYFGMTVEQYEARVVEQNGRCAVCKRTPEESDPRRKQLCVDHDHSCCPGVKSCGKCIRGLVCHSCNVSMGHFQDSPTVLQAAIDYLNKHKAA